MSVSVLDSRVLQRFYRCYRTHHFQRVYDRRSSCQIVFSLQRILQRYGSLLRGNVPQSTSGCPLYDSPEKR